MSGLSFYAFLPPQDVDYSNITDLAIYAVGGTNMLFSTTRFDGVMSSWTITANGPVLNNVRSFEGGLRAGGTGSLQEITLGGTGRCNRAMCYFFMDLSTALPITRLWAI